MNKNGGKIGITHKLSRRFKSKKLVTVTVICSKFVPEYCKFMAATHLKFEEIVWLRSIYPGKLHGIRMQDIFILPSIYKDTNYKELERYLFDNILDIEGSIYHVIAQSV